MWPNLRIIHIYRDGRDCAISMSKHHAFRLQILRRELVKKTTFYNIIPLPPDFISNEAFFQKDIPLWKFGELWNEMIINGLTELSKIPLEQRLNISYEELVANPQQILQKLINFINPELEYQKWIESIINTIPKSSTSWKSLDSEEVDKLTESCKNGIYLLKYL